MPGAAENDEASETLRAMTKEIQANRDSLHPFAKFNDTKVVGLITQWIKVGMLMRGSSYFRNVKLFLIKKGTPDKPDPKFSRPGELYADLNLYRIKISDSGGDDATFTNAERAMLNFIYEYRGQFKANSKGEKAFEHALTVAVNNEENSEQ
jgi:hypothetical protein